MSRSRCIPVSAKALGIKDLGLKQTRTAARALIIGFFQSVESKEDPRGLSEEHMRWMLDRISRDKTFTLAKASRWLGYVQAWLVLYQHAPLEYVKQNVRSARGDK